MEIWQTLEFIWDSQIEPFIELNMGLDNIIDFGQTFYVELLVLGPPEAIANSQRTVCVLCVHMRAHIRLNKNNQIID